MVDQTEGMYVVIGGDIAPLRSALSDASRLSSSFASNLTRAFTDASLKGRALSDVLRDLAFSLSQNTLEAALAPISRAFGDSLTQLLGGTGLVPSVPEAILPLARGRDGRLGVRSDGSAPAMNVTFNVSTQDADSFRRSEGQIAAMLARAVGRGQRNL